MYFKHVVRQAILVAGMILLILPYATASESNAGADTTHRTANKALEGDTVFSEIHLSPDGVYAVDSQGEEWRYDFDRAEFVPGRRSESSTRTVFGRKIYIPEAEINIPSPPGTDISISTRSIKGLQLRGFDVDTNDTLRGPLVALGPVTVRGVVLGDVISYNKITVTSTGEIDGDARAPIVRVLRGGIVRGEIDEADVPRLPGFDIETVSSFTALITNISILFALLLAGFLAMAVLSRPINRIKVCLEKRFIKSFLLGLFFWFALIPLFGLLCLTIVGIPVALIALPLATTSAIVMGIIGLCQMVGQKLGKSFGIPHKSQLSQVLLGILILDAFWIIMSLFFISRTGLSHGFAILFLVLAIVIWFIGTTAGIGGVILTRFGSRDCKEALVIRVEMGGESDQMPPPPPPSPPPLTKDGSN
jgi:hypothetical protein